MRDILLTQMCFGAEPQNGGKEKKIVIAEKMERRTKLWHTEVEKAIKKKSNLKERFLAYERKIWSLSK